MQALASTECNGEEHCIIKNSTVGAIIWLVA